VRLYKSYMVQGSCLGGYKQGRKAALGETEWWRGGVSRRVAM
jgi:hypothetical protein